MNANEHELGGGQKCLCSGHVPEECTRAMAEGAVGPSPVRVHSRSFVVHRLVAFLGSGSFAAFAIFVLLFYTVFIAIMAFAPPGTGAWAAYLEEFRLRCFQLDPVSGVMRMPSIVLMLTEPLPLAAIFFFLWRAPLRRVWCEQRLMFAHAAGAALLLVASIAVSLVGFGSSRADATPTGLPFPADRLRTTLPVPEFNLVNQDGNAVRLADFKGRVVLLTAVYSTCTTTCPMMLSKIRQVLAELTPEQRSQLAVVAFSLNPEADTRELRAATARIYGLDQAQFHFVNGMPAEMNALLDKLAVARTRDEKTGQIMHSNLFYLIDREGRIAYRLSLSQREQSWLGDALRVLLADPA